MCCVLGVLNVMNKFFVVIVVSCLLAACINSASAQDVIIGGGPPPVVAPPVVVVPPVTVPPVVPVVPTTPTTPAAQAPVASSSASVMPGVILYGIGSFLAYRAIVCTYYGAVDGVSFSPKRGYEVRGVGRKGCNNDAYYGKWSRRGKLVAKPWAPF